ncbi:MAG: hypothetical protein PHO70_01930 [Candidatus Omnitrophica bacterium]|nr:hypothetical protein [Candidatus Omnitrophota bacterium]
MQLILDKITKFVYIKSMNKENKVAQKSDKQQKDKPVYKKPSFVKHGNLRFININVGLS